MREPLVVNFEKIDWGLVVLKFLRNPDVNILSVDRRDNSEFFLSFQDTNVLLVHCFVWLPFEVGPLSVKKIPLSKNLSQAPPILMVLDIELKPLWVRAQIQILDVV